MRKRIHRPETGEWADHEVAYADAVATDHDGYTRLYCSGIVAEGETVAAQTRGVLETLEEVLSAYDGDLRDVIRVRVYVARPHLTDETLETIHDVRQEFFGPPHLPASTLVEVEGLVRDAFVVEIDADAVIPDDGWTVETTPIRQ